MIEEKEVKTWWAYLYNNEEYDDDSIVVGELLDHHPKQGPLHWQAGLFEVVQKSEFDSQSQLLKEKEETIQSLQKSLFGRSAHADVMEHKATKANALLCEKDARIEELETALSYIPKVPTQPSEKELAKRLLEKEEEIARLREALGWYSRHKIGVCKTECGTGLVVQVATEALEKGDGDE